MLQCKMGHYDAFAKLRYFLDTFEIHYKRNLKLYKLVLYQDPELDKLIQKSKEIKQSNQQKSLSNQLKSQGPSKSAESESTQQKNVVSSAPSQPITKDKETTPKRKEIKILPKPSKTLYFKKNSFLLFVKFKDIFSINLTLSFLPREININLVLLPLAPVAAKVVKVDHAQLQCAECGKHVPHHAALKSHFNSPSPEQKQDAACR